MATVSNFPVYSEAQMEQAITSYIAQGFALSNRTPTTATMFKAKQFSIVWLIVGLLLCVVPFLIYLIIYATESDRMVQIYMADPASAPALAPPLVGQLSPDGQWRWEGTQWVLVHTLTAEPGHPPARAESQPAPDDQVGQS